MGDNDDLPYKAEYAKSGRAKCKGCKSDIPKGDLRMASLTQSAFFDGKQANWFHQNCFFGRNRPKDTSEIGHFESLRWEDQEKIKAKIASGGDAPLPAGKGKSKKKLDNGSGGNVDGTIIKDFRTEYAKSGAAKCRTCEEKIAKGEVRIAKKDYDDDRAKMYGPMDRWHHAKCFIKNREKYEFFTSADNLAGLNTLSGDDKTMLKNELKKLKRKAENGSNGTDEPDAKRIKTEDIKEDPEKEEMKRQNKKMFYYRDLLEKNLKKKELEMLLEVNDQELPTGAAPMLDRLGDIMTFGALKPCKECNGGQFVYQSGVGYRCTGDLTEWTKCQVKTLTPDRKPFKVPEDFRGKFDFLSMYKYKERTRVIPNIAAVIKSNNAASNGQGTSTSSLLPLTNMSFVLSGNVDKKKLQKKIEALGGTLSNKVTSDTLALISDKETVLAGRSKVSDAKKYNITVVDETFLAGVKTEGVISMVKQHTLSDWGQEPEERISKALSKSLAVGTSKSGSARFTSKDLPKSVKLKLKGGAYVDPESGLEHKAHVLKTKEGLHTAVLGATNIQDGKNSYYKLQLLEHDKKKKWYVFRSWGRIGTTIGGTKTEDFEDMYEALRSFEFQYEEKTGNKWRKRQDFKKVAGRFFPLDIDMGEDNEKIKKINLEKSTSKLAKSIQKLVSMVFDIESMKKAMLEFEIDLTKMPLGKLSKKQIESAYKILTEAQDMIKTESGSEGKFLDLSNRFFTLIPHDFGMRQPPLLDNPDLVKSKIGMLDNLLEIELAFNLLSSGGEESQDKDPIDAHYAKLNTDVSELPRDSDEWKMLETYVKNTHAATHTQYTLEIQEIFKLERKGEKKRFKPFKQLPNHMLLWHGSRTTNFAGILSQGLRIAPPEAPVTGYMFGKGVYFADMVSKSANYCATNKTNNTALLMLCQVALGNMYERFGADYIEKLPAGFHSCKGVGKTEPDSAGLQEMDGVKVPTGQGVKDANKKTDLLYNEYIVYDVAQIQAKYLFQMKFNYKI